MPKVKAPINCYGSKVYSERMWSELDKFRIDDREVGVEQQEKIIQAAMIKDFQLKCREVPLCPEHQCIVDVTFKETHTACQLVLVCNGGTK